MSRRRRNPTLGDVNTLLMVGVTGVALYLVYKLVSAAPKVVTAAGAAVSKALVPNPTAGATIILPDGSEVPYESVTWRKWIGWFNTLAQFDYNGVGYQLLDNKPDETNTYYAEYIMSELPAPPTPQTPLTPEQQAIQDQFNVIAQSG